MGKFDEAHEILKTEILNHDKYADPTQFISHFRQILYFSFSFAP